MSVAAPDSFFFKGMFSKQCQSISLKKIRAIKTKHPSLPHREAPEAEGKGSDWGVPDLRESPGGTQTQEYHVNKHEKMGEEPPKRGAPPPAPLKEGFQRMPRV